MKQRKILGITSLLTMAGLTVVLTSNSSGPGGNRTGSPGSSGTCTSCHGSNNNLASSVTAELIDKSTNTPVTDIIPSTTYTLRIKSKGNSSKMGFQAVILDASNAPAGTFGAAPSKTNVSSSKVWGHTSPGTSNGENVWEIDWQAPSSISGNLNIYAASVISNGNGSDNGDDVKTAVQQLKANSNSTTVLSQNAVKLLGNPITKGNQLEINQTLKMAVVWNLNGQVVLKQNNCNSINVTDFHSGNYILQGIDQNGNRFSEQFTVVD
jgi:hypothetical protein